MPYRQPHSREGSRISPGDRFHGRFPALLTCKSNADSWDIAFFFPLFKTNNSIGSILFSMEECSDALVCAHKEVFADWVPHSRSVPVPLATKWEFANETLAEQRVNFLDKSYTPICRNHPEEDHLIVLRYITHQRTQPVI